MNRIQKYAISLGLAFSFVGLSAQDNHFSQSYSVPSLLNPALTGLFEGGYRISSIYRDQWRQVLLDPLTSFSTVGEVRFGREAKRLSKSDFFGVGLTFQGNRVRQFDFNTTQLKLSGAYHKSLDRKNRQYLSAGFRLGVVQKNINYNDLNFQDQFNGVNGFDLPTFEDLPSNNFGYFDMGFGLHYSMVIDDFTKLYIGGSYDHLTGPDISFYQNFEAANLFEYASNTIDRKITAHISLEASTTGILSFTPRAIFVNQGQHTLLQAGSNLKFELQKTDNTSIHIGVWARGVQDENNSPRLESIIGIVGIELNNILFALSFENSLDDIINEFKGQGAIELTISYIGNYDNDIDYCPEF